LIDHQTLRTPTLKSVKEIKSGWIGKVLKSTRNHYLVKTDSAILTCIVRGRVVGSGLSEHSAVKVGDDVRVELITPAEGAIQEILPRRSKLSRAVEGKAYREHLIAVNIDQMIIIMSVKQPGFKSGLLDRYLVIAEKNGLKSIICLNKIDLADKSGFKQIASQYQKLNYPFHFTSVVTGEGMEEFKSFLEGKVSVLVGHSGVGKSSMIQKIEPAIDLKVADISQKTNKGKHSTTYVELFPLSFGGYLMDTPGIRELGLWDIYQNELKQYFTEFAKFERSCQFNDCQHLKEPGCAVKKALEKGKISGERYKNYCNIQSDLRAAPYELIKRR
jgi:ribosome biogenesis GTPase / thiamine phosphate phosphatase